MFDDGRRTHNSISSCRYTSAHVLAEAIRQRQLYGAYVSASQIEYENDYLIYSRCLSTYRRKQKLFFNQIKYRAYDYR